MQVALSLPRRLKVELVIRVLITRKFAMLDRGAIAFLETVVGDGRFVAFV